jgi:Protein of unknown function (DUF2480)
VFCGSLLVIHCCYCQPAQNPELCRCIQRILVMNDDLLVNKVAQSGLITLNLEDYYPKEEVALFDLKEHLYMGLILKEKEFREALKQTDWSAYQDKIVALTCTADAIIPMWAWMLAAASLQPVAKEVIMGDAATAIKQHMLRQLAGVDAAQYAGQRIVVKGCGEKEVAPDVYVEITRLLRPHAQSIMFGEPCSTVPVYKKKA